MLDLYDAHIATLSYLRDRNILEGFNLVNGYGFTIFQVIGAIVSVTGKTLLIGYDKRRTSAPETLLADTTLERKTMGWLSQHSDLDAIVTHAWASEQKHYLNYA